MNSMPLTFSLGMQILMATDTATPQSDPLDVDDDGVGM